MIYWKLVVLKLNFESLFPCNLSCESVQHGRTKDRARCHSGLVAVNANAVIVGRLVHLIDVISSICFFRFTSLRRDTTFRSFVVYQGRLREPLSYA